MEFSKTERCFPTLISYKFENALEFGDQTKAKIPRGHSEFAVKLAVESGPTQIAFLPNTMCVWALLAPSGFLSLSVSVCSSYHPEAGLSEAVHGIPMPEDERSWGQLGHVLHLSFFLMEKEIDPQRSGRFHWS